MLESLQEFTKNFFYDSPDHNNKKPYEPYHSRRLKKVSPNYQSIRANSRRNRIQKPTSSNYNFNARRRSDIDEGLQYYRSSSNSSSVKGPSRLNRMKNYLMSIFSNDTETINSLKKSCHNISVRRRNTNFDTNNSYLNIKQRIENSDAFRSKLSELKYDKEQLQNLRRSTYRNTIMVPNENMSHKNLDEDKVFLLRNENRLLKRDLKAKTSELDTTKQRLELALEKNRKYAKDINELKIRLNDYIIENDKSSMRHDTLLNPPTLGKPFEKKLGQDANVNKYNITIDLNNNGNMSDSISPVRVDFSRYSDNFGTTTSPNV